MKKKIQQNNEFFYDTLWMLKTMDIFWSVSFLFDKSYKVNNGNEWKIWKEKLKVNKQQNNWFIERKIGWEM